MSLKRRLQSQPKRLLFARLALLAGKRFKGNTAKSIPAYARTGRNFSNTTLTVMKSLAVKGALSLAILTLLAVASTKSPGGEFHSPFSPNPQSQSSWFSLRSESSTLRLTLSDAPCTLGTPYPDQPTAACQQTYDLHRLTVFLIAASSLQLLFLAFIAMMAFRSNR